MIQHCHLAEAAAIAVSSSEVNAGAVPLLRRFSRWSATEGCADSRSCDWLRPCCQSRVLKHSKSLFLMEGKDETGSFFEFKLRQRHRSVRWAKNVCSTLCFASWRGDVVDRHPVKRFGKTGGRFPTFR
jgi:hypothetical protein